MAKLKTMTRKELFATLSEEQQAVVAEIVAKVALKETNRHYITKKEVELRKDMTGAQCAMLDALIKAILGVAEAE